MQLSDILNKFKDAREVLTVQAPDFLEQASSFFGKLQAACSAGASFLRDLGPSVKTTEEDVRAYQGIESLAIEVRGMTNRVGGTQHSRATATLAQSLLFAINHFAERYDSASE